MGGAWSCSTASSDVAVLPSARPSSALSASEAIASVCSPALDEHASFTTFDNNASSQADRDGTAVAAATYAVAAAVTAPSVPVARPVAAAASSSGGDSVSVNGTAEQQELSMAFRSNHSDATGSGATNNSIDATRERIQGRTSSQSLGVDDDDVDDDVDVLGTRASPSIEMGPRDRERERERDSDTERIQLTRTPPLNLSAAAAMAAAAAGGGGADDSDDYMAAPQRSPRGIGGVSLFAYAHDLTQDQQQPDTTAVATPATAPAVTALNLGSSSTSAGSVNNGLLSESVVSVRSVHSSTTPRNASGGTALYRSQMYMLNRSPTQAGLSMSTSTSGSNAGDVVAGAGARTGRDRDCSCSNSSSGRVSVDVDALMSSRSTPRDAGASLDEHVPPPFES